MNKWECTKCGKPEPDIFRQRKMKIYFGAGGLVGTIFLCMACYGRLVAEFIAAPGPREIAEHMEMRSRGHV